MLHTTVCRCLLRLNCSTMVSVHTRDYTDFSLSLSLSLSLSRRTHTMSQLTGERFTTLESAIVACVIAKA
ncbi:MAG: hypothetical protein N7Q72_04710, partial [Spiroplasma sp. Tabriz.8]|nr:hypothetical protein [Spiroplasma sp. Tabriz.8]